MKYVSFIIILAWAIWIICTKPDLKFEDNPFLFILSIVSVFYCVFFLIKKK